MFIWMVVVLASSAWASVCVQPAPDATLVLHSPRDFQVFQRAIATEGLILVSGRAPRGCESVRIHLTGNRWDGGAIDATWVEAVDAVTSAFLVRIQAPAGGWYAVEVAAMHAGEALATGRVEHVGVGEVFVGAGQSNSTNSGGEGRLQQSSGMVSTFSGADWRIADDPQPGTHDKSGGGSFWPAFGDAMYERFKVPIGVAVTGHGGTSVAQWQNNGELFNWLMTRVRQLGPGGFRALLWHQGESDVGTPPEEYLKGMTQLIEDSKAAAGWEFPWFVAQVSYHNPDRPSFESTRTVQSQLWNAGIALEGPDTDTLTGDNRDAGGKGIHFSPKGLRAHGLMWADKVGAYVQARLDADESGR